MHAEFVCGICLGILLMCIVYLLACMCEYIEFLKCTGRKK